MSAVPRWADRSQAGRALAAAVARRFAQHPPAADVVVLALPRGGVPVGAPVAAALRAPLDVVVVRKLGVPEQPELAMGAVAAVGGASAAVELVRHAVVADHVAPAEFAAVREREVAVLREREEHWRAGRAPLAVAGRVVVIVDDGLATGATMRAAVAAVRAQDPASVVVAVPVGAPEAVRAVSCVADDVVCLAAPVVLGAVGQAYVDFAPTSDDAVRGLLSLVRR